MYNKVIISGNLTRDVEVRHTASGTPVAATAIATNRKYKSQTGETKEETCFVDIAFFGRIAEIAGQYLHRGSKVLIDGRLKLEQWTDQNGQKRSKYSIVVENMQMLDGKSRDSENRRAIYDDFQSAATERKPADTRREYEMSIEEEEVPF